MLSLKPREGGIEVVNRARFIGLGVGAGTALGAGFGLLIDNLALGVCAGLAVGTGFGIALSAAGSKQKPERSKAARDDGSGSAPLFYGAGSSDQIPSGKSTSGKGSADKDAGGWGDGDGGGGDGGGGD